MNGSISAPSFLSATARWTAAARALETAREGGLFRDPWAQALAGEEGMRWLAERQGNVLPMVLRTCYFDDYLEQAARDGGIRQVVILAAGLDTRAYRLSWPAGTVVFEVDQPEVLAHKARVMAGAGARPVCELRPLAADLTGAWGEMLTHCGFDPALPSAWLLEGILFYLPPEAIAKLIDAVSALAAPGSRVGFDIVNSVTLTSPYTRAWVEMQAKHGAPWLGTMDDPEAFLQERGWTASLTQPGASDANYGRWSLPNLPVKMPGLPHQWFVVGKKIQIS